MHIGITYDLRSEYLAAGYSEEETAEFDRDDTIDAIESAIRELGHRPDRIGNAKQLMTRLVGGDRWDLVFNICEGLRGVARESQVPAILDVYEIPYTFADPCVMSICLHKGLTKTLLRRAHIPTPEFRVVTHDAPITDEAEGSGHPLRFPLFVKPVAEGTGKGITSASRVTNATELAQQCRWLLPRFREGLLIEEFLPGREFTVGLLGTGSQARVLGTLEIVLRADAESDVYSYVNKERCEELVEYRHVRPEVDAEVRQAEEIALRAWRVLGCRDGGRIDLRSNAAGLPEFIEANPLAGLHPAHSDLPMIATAVGMPYHILLGHIIDSARKVP